MVDDRKYVALRRKHRKVSQGGSLVHHSIGSNEVNCMAAFASAAFLAVCVALSLTLQVMVLDL